MKQWLSTLLVLLMVACVPPSADAQGDVISDQAVAVLRLIQQRGMVFETSVAEGDPLLHIAPYWADTTNEFVPLLTFKIGLFELWRDLPGKPATGIIEGRYITLVYVGNGGSGWRIYALALTEEAEAWLQP